MTQSVMSASMDMGVGYSAIVKLCRYLDMNAINHITFATHRKAIMNASMVTVTNILSGTAKVVGHVYANPSLTDAEMIDLTISYDGS